MPDRDALITRVTTSIAAGDPPDLFLINYRFYGQFADRGVLEPLQERLDGSDVLAEDAMYDLALDAFRDDKGDLICLPQNVSSLVVYYNRDLFEAAGVPLPKAGLDVGRHDGRGGGACATAISTGWVSRRRSSGWRRSCGRTGATSSTTPTEPTRLTLDTPESLDALEKFLALGADGLIPTAEESAAEDDEARFANGRLAMYLNSRRVTPQFRLIDGLRVGRRPVARAR